jgi:hypothetical protein
MRRRDVIKGGGSAGLLVLAGCGGGSASPSPTNPTVTATPTPTPAPTPTPTPAPTPTPTPAAGDLTVYRLTIKIEHVVGVDGKTRLTNPSPSEPFFVGEVVRLDATAKTWDDRATEGSGIVEWQWAPETGVVKWNGGTTFNPRLDVRAAGQVTCRATLDGVTSNELTLTFKELYT